MGQQSDNFRERCAYPIAVTKTRLASALQGNTVQAVGLDKVAGDLQHTTKITCVLCSMHACSLHRVVELLVADRQVQVVVQLDILLGRHSGKH
jgi:hypothetical protein